MITSNQLIQANLKIIFSPAVAIFVLFTLLTFILAQTEVSEAIKSGSDLSYFKAWVLSATSTYSYALLYPIIIACCKKWKLGKGNTFQSIAKLIVLFFPFIMGWLVLVIISRTLVLFIFYGEYWEVGSFYNRYFYELPKVAPHYLMTVFAYYTIMYVETSKAEQFRAAKLSEQLLSAQLSLLKEQLKPHFLFNTLNLISSTMYQDVDKADQVLTRLADLLRYSLNSEKNVWITLQQELVAMTTYLEIAELRFEDKLSTTINVEANAAQLMIPAMLLQPLIENAIKYGIEPSTEREVLQINITLENEMLVIRIINPNINDPLRPSSFGFGILNTKERLAILYDGDASFALDMSDKNIVICTLCLPILSSAEVLA